MTEQQREAFERWYNAEYVRPIIPADRTEGGYQHPDAQAAWDAWQAALSHAEGEAVGTLTIDRHGDEKFRALLPAIDLEPGTYGVYTHPAPQAAVQSWPGAPSWDDAPVNAQSLACNKDGRWHWFTIPNPYADGNEWNIPPHLYETAMKIPAGKIAYCLNWHDTLELRPTAPAGEPTVKESLTVPAPDEREIAAKAIDAMVDHCEHVQYGNCPHAIEVDTILEYAKELRAGNDNDPGRTVKPHRSGGGLRPSEPDSGHMGIATGPSALDRLRAGKEDADHG